MKGGIFSLILVILVVVASACRPAVPTPLEKEAPTVPKRPSPSPAALEGKALVEERCTVCHGLGQIEKAKKTAEGWKSTVERMKGKGAKLNAAESEAVIEYLSATFKP